MSILQPSKETEFDSTAIFQEPEGVVLTISEGDDDSDLDPCDNMDKSDVGND